MKTKFTFLLLCLATCLCAQSTTKADEKTIAHLKKFRQDYIQAYLNKKTESIQLYYSDRIRVMPELQKTLLGKNNVVSYHKAFLNRFELTHFTRNEMEILDLGTQVLEIGKLMMKLKLKSSGKEFELMGTYLNLWEESSTGELSLITEAWNYEQYYGEIHEHLKFEEVNGIHVGLLPNVVINNNISFELNALNRLLDVTVTLRDANTWSHYYAEDAILVPNYHPPYLGKKAIDEYIQMHVKELPIFESLDIRSDRIDDLGEYIIEYASHIASWKNGNSSGVNFGKNIKVWRRDPNHSLKVFRSMAMYD